MSMSQLRFNEKELISYATTKDDAILRGPLKKVSKKSKSKYLWIVIKGNLLFVFKPKPGHHSLKSEPCPDHAAHSCYVLESCYPETTDVGFKVTFNGSKTSYLAFICAPNQANIWVQTIKQANFKFLRNQLVYYNSLLEKYENEESLVEVKNNIGTASFFFRIQGLQIMHTDCEIQIQVTCDDNECNFKTAKNYCDPNEIVFYEALILCTADLRFTYNVLISRTSTAAKQPCHINVFSTSFCPMDLLSIMSTDVKECITPIDEPHASGILSITAINCDDALQKVTKQSNHRSSCLFSETIQPLPMSDKDQMFSSIFVISSEKNYIVNPMAVIDNSPVTLLHESLLKLNYNINIVTAYLEFILQSDTHLLHWIKDYNDSNDYTIASTKNLEFRVDITTEHKMCLEDVKGTLKRHKSLRRSGYQTLFFPSNLAVYRAKILDTSLERYEIFEKVILSTPTKNTDNDQGGGLYSMLCDDHIKQSFYLCQKFTKIKDKIVHLSKQMRAHLEMVAYSLANSKLDDLVRHFKDYEATAITLITICANADVADLVINLAVALGEENASRPYVWLDDNIIYIDHTWSIGAHFRDLKSQIENLSAVCSEMIEDYKSDLWVESLFLPCHKLQRDLESLVTVSTAGLDFKIHCAQNVSSAMNRFTMRSDAVTSQLFLSVITTIYSSIYIYMDDVFFWLQLLNVGFFVQIESLLSCTGSERAMLEDMYVAAEFLKTCKIEIVCKDEGAAIPHFSGSRYNPVICVPVPTRIYALLLDVCQGHSNRQLNIIPLFCNQILSKHSTMALSVAERQFIQTINIKSVEYIRCILDKNNVFYDSIEDAEKKENIFMFLEQLIGLYHSESLVDPSIILPLFQQLGKVLCAGQIVTCANGIDSSAMSVSYSLVHYLKSSYRVPEEDSTKILRSLRHGVLLGRAGSLRTYDHFLSQGEMFAMYQPPDSERGLKFKGSCCSVSGFD